jgi:hypothetical protein
MSFLFCLIISVQGFKRTLFFDMNAKKNEKLKILSEIARRRSFNDTFFYIFNCFIFNKNNTFLKEKKREKKKLSLFFENEFL